jgi:hypothetical protein
MAMTRRRLAAGFPLGAGLHIASGVDMTAAALANRTRRVLAPHTWHQLVMSNFMSYIAVPRPGQPALNTAALLHYTDQLSLLLCLYPKVLRPTSPYKANAFRNRRCDSKF